MRRHQVDLLLNCIKTVMITLIILVYIRELPRQHSPLFKHKICKMYIQIMNSERPCYKLYSYKA